MSDKYWWSLRKTLTIIYVEYAHAHAKLFATDAQLQKGPPVALKLDLEKNLRTRFTGSGTYVDAVELAGGEIGQLTRVEISDDQIRKQLGRILSRAEERVPPWQLFLKLRGLHEFTVQPEYRVSGEHRTLVLHVLECHRQ